MVFNAFCKFYFTKLKKNHVLHTPNYDLFAYVKYLHYICIIQYLNVYLFKTKYMSIKKFAKFVFREIRNEYTQDFTIVSIDDKTPDHVFTLDEFIFSRYPEAKSRWLLCILYDSKFHYMLFDDLKIRFFAGRFTIYVEKM